MCVFQSGLAQYLRRDELSRGVCVRERERGRERQRERERERVCVCV